jgi:hypothetical protein
MKLETMMGRGMRSSRAAGLLVVTLVLAVFTARTGGAQLDPGNKPALASQAPAAAPASAAMPMPAPNAALDQLKFFAGNWQCAGTGYVEGKGHPTSATVNMGWDLNGFFMTLRYEEKKTGVNPMPIAVVEHWGYSDELKKLIAGHVDSMGGYGTEVTAGWEGNTLVWVGDDHMMGMKMPGRDTFVKQGDNGVTHLGEMQQNGAWIKQDEETCYRVK